MIIEIPSNTGQVLLSTDSGDNNTFSSENSLSIGIIIGLHNF